MSAKMLRARYREKYIGINEYKEEMHGKIFCPNCGTPITHVKDHVRSVGGCDVRISAYFRLTNNEKSPHLDQCSYITENAIKNIYAACCSTDDILTKQGQTYVVRLHVLVDNIQMMTNTNTNSYGNKDKKTNLRSLTYIQNGEKPAYITTIKRILELRCRLDQDGIRELKEKVKLQFYNYAKKQYDEIPWNNFFFEYDKANYLRAYKYIVNKIYHPVVFCGKVKSIAEPTEKISFYSMRIYGVKVEDGKYVSLNVQFSAPQLYDEIKTYEKCNVVVYGSNTYAKEVDRSGVKFLNINTTIYGINQVLKIERF